MEGINTSEEMKSLISEITKILREWREDYWKQNLPERLKRSEKEVELLQGNAEEMRKRLETMEKHLGVEYAVERKYKKK